MGKVIMSGIVPPLVAPVTGILASELAVGSSVYLMENGVAVEYLIVNQGKPSGSSLYDDSCDGLWLLRKDIYENRAWHSAYTNSYRYSSIHTYLNGTFLSMLGSIEQAVIKQVKIPYVNGTGTSGSVASGTNGLSTKVFLLGGHEVGFTSSVNKNFPVDGATLSYFIIGDTTSAREKRISKLNGSATNWWLRTCFKMDDQQSWCINQEGSANTGSCPYTYGIRPSIVLPSNALFDPNTLILKGVA